MSVQEPNGEVPTFRFLREGERVAIPEIGVPHAFLSGTGVRVAEWSDGSITAMLPPPAALDMIKSFVFCELMLLGRAFEGAELRFVRRAAGQSRGDLALSLTMDEAQVAKYEDGKEAIPSVITLAVQRMFLPKMIQDLNRLPEHVREWNRRNLEIVQNCISLKSDAHLQVEEGIFVDIDDPALCP